MVIGAIDTGKSTLSQFLFHNLSTPSNLSALIDADLGQSGPYMYGFSGENLSRSIVAIGDYNGDGYDDFCLGNPRWDSNRSDYHLFTGRPRYAWGSVIALEDWNPGPEEGGRYGFSLGGPGDLNGDGRDDFVVGAPQASNGFQKRRLVL